MIFRNERFQKADARKDNSDSEGSSTDEEEENEALDDTDDTLTTKWMGCANHTLQLVLDLLDKDNAFRALRKAVIGTLVEIRRSSNAVRDFYDLTGRCVKIPVETR